MTLLPGISDFGELNTVILDTYAWRVVDSGYDDLLSCPALRGEDLVMHGAKGRRAYPRIIDATVVSIPMLITGAFDQDGDPIENPRKGLFENRDYLRDNLGFADDSDRGTVPFIFYRDDLPNWAGDVTFLGLNDWTTIGRHDAMARLDISIPDGELEETGS